MIHKKKFANNYKHNKNCKIDVEIIIRKINQRPKESYIYIRFKYLNHKIFLTDTIARIVAKSMIFTLHLIYNDIKLR